MAYWLLKTEPSAYSFDRLEKERRTVWDGVANPVALRNLRTVEKGDGAIIYHTGDERSAVGVAEVLRSGYADPKDPKLVVIDIAPKERLPHPVSLAALKAHRAFAQSPLVRQGRLSVVPLSEEQWDVLCALGKG